MAFLPSLLHVNRPLSDMVISYQPSADGYLRDKFFQRKQVANMSNQIRQISRDQLLRIYPMLTGPAGKVANVQFGTDSTITFNVSTYALEAVLDNQERANADSELQYDMRQMQAPLEALSRGLEWIAVTQTLRSTTNLTKNQTNAAGSFWSDYNSIKSDPLDDLMIAGQSILTNTGKKANCLAMDVMTWKKFVQHPNVLSRSPVHVAGSSGAVMTKDILQQIMDVWLEPNSIYITGSRYNSANEYAAMTLKSFIGPDVLMAYCDTPGPMSYGVGYEFAFNGLGGNDPFLVLQYQDLNRGPLGSDVVRLVAAVDYHITNDKAAYYIKNAVDSSLSEFNSQL